RRGGAATCLHAAECARIVEADIDADREVGRRAEEPGVLGIVGGAGLAGDRPAERRELGRGAPRGHAQHHVDDLVNRGGIVERLARVDDAWRLWLLAVGGRAAALADARLVTVDRLAITILHAID